MTRRRRTLPGMDIDYPAQQRLAREVRDLIMEQGGDWEWVGEALERRYVGDELELAQFMAVGMLFVYRDAPDGPRLFAAWRERDPAPEPEPAPRRRRRRVA